MIQTQITARIHAFVAELHALVSEAALEAVHSALGARPETPTRGAAEPRRRGRPSRKVRVAAPRSRPAAPRTAPVRAESGAPVLSVKRKKGAKRTPELLARTDAAILAYVKGSPGGGVERMAKALRVPSKDLKGRISALIDAWKLKKTGVKRATKYFPA